MHKYIPNAMPNLTGQEEGAVNRAIRASNIAVGPEISEFEQKIAQYVGAKYGIATNSGTSALHLCLLQCGLKPGDLVITSPFSFAATVNSILYTEALPYFIDIDASTMCLCTAKLREYIVTQCYFENGVLIDQQLKRRVGAILPVHVYGHVSDMRDLNALSDQYNIPIVEDGAEALGSLYRGRHIGADSKFFSLSFNGNKIITTGGGGMVLTNSAEVANRTRHLANQSKLANCSFMHDELGYNYRMPNINAAIGLAQASALTDYVRTKRQIANTYRDGLGNIDGLEIMWESHDFKSSFWMPVLKWDRRIFDVTASDLISTLQDYNIEGRHTWFPLNGQPAYSECPGQNTPIAKALSRSSVCLPCSTFIGESDQLRILDILLDFFIKQAGQ